MTIDADHDRQQPGSEPPPQDGGERRTISLFGRSVAMPRARWLRILIGVLLVVFGCLGFLPVLGFWMVPLGLLVLSYEFATVRRWRRRATVYFARRGKRSG
jgi:hypothetical protein